jgi:soluble lytic murein transglycosylase
MVQAGCTTYAHFLRPDGSLCAGNPAQYYSAFFARNVSPGGSGAVPGDIAEAVRILYRAGRDEERDLFLRAALNKLTADKKPQALIALAKEVRSPKMALAAAKASYENGVLVRDALFPETSPPRQANLEKALTLGIIRQESMFDRYAVSPAGARGLMQLMPATASHTARKIGVAHRNPSQLFEPTHNMQLGQAYLAGLMQRYDDFIPLAAAAYNAGPGNVDKWLVQMGDPRQDPRSWIDWVERIPFYETRNYVQRVWEAYSLYKAMN